MFSLQGALGSSEHKGVITVALSHNGWYALGFAGTGDRWLGQRCLRDRRKASTSSPGVRELVRPSGLPRALLSRYSDYDLQWPSWYSGSSTTALPGCMIAVPIDCAVVGTGMSRLCTNRRRPSDRAAGALLLLLIPSLLPNALPLSTSLQLIEGPISSIGRRAAHPRATLREALPTLFSRLSSFLHALFRPRHYRSAAGWKRKHPL